MPIEWLYLGVGFLFAVLFCKAVEIIVERARSLFVGKSDVIDLYLFKMELNALNKKIDALRIKLDSLKIGVNALNTKLDSLSRKQLSLVPASPGSMLEYTTGNSEDTWTRDALVSETSIAPTVGDATPDDTWTRDTLVSDAPIVPTISQPDLNPTWTRDGGDKLVVDPSSPSPLSRV